jgi:hypothetical protein
MIDEILFSFWLSNYGVKASLSTCQPHFENAKACPRCGRFCALLGL